MKMNKFLLVFLILLLFFSNPSTAQRKLTILHTNNINGTLENCLCPEHPYGSLEKIKVQVDKIRKETKNLLMLDAGDILSPFGDVVKDSFVVAAMKLIGYDAISVGDQEFSNGVKFLENYVKKSDLSLISANITVNGSNPFPSYIIKNIGDLNVGIIGVISARAFTFFPPEKIKGVKTDDHKTAITFVIETLRGKIDLIILLSHLGYHTDEEIAKAFPDINIIVGGHTQNVLKEPVKIGNTLIVQAGRNGYYLGRLDIELDSQNKIRNYNGKLITMELSFPNDPQILKLIKSYKFRVMQR